MMNLMPVSRTPYDVPIVIAVNTSERMKPFEKEILSCLSDVLMCIEDLQYNYGKHINVIVKLVTFNDCVVIDEIKIGEHINIFLLYRQLGYFHGAANAEMLFTCLNNIFVPELYRENRLKYGNVPVVFITDGFYGLEDKSDSSKQIHPIKDDDNIDVFASLNDYDHDFLDCDDEYDCYRSVFEAHFDDGQTFKTTGRDFLGLIEPLFESMKIDRHGISPLQEIICVKDYRRRMQTKRF